MLKPLPTVFELRRSQTLAKTGIEHNGTSIAMLPVELLHVPSQIAGLPAVQGD